MNSWLNSSENVVDEIKPTPSTSKITSLSKPKKTIEMKDENDKGKGKEVISQLKSYEESASDDSMDLDADPLAWEQAIKIIETVEKDHLEKELKSLSMEDKPSLKRKQPHMDGEDLFTREAVKNWQPPRLRAWHARHTSPETYYFRLVVPGQLQHNGSWSKEEKKRFMERYQEWIDKGIRIGTMWGIFSKAFPHRVGYQCMSYYRSLVKKGILKDENYTIVDGKLKGSNNRFGAPSISNYSLDPEWETEEVKQIERQVDEWIKEFHGGSAIKQPAVVRRKPTTATSTTTARSRNQKSRISDMITKMPQKQPRGENDDDDDDDDFVDNGDAEVAHLQERDWDKEWKERLEAYKDFLTPYLDKEKRHQYWQAKQEWRRGLLTTEMLMQKSMIQKTSSTLPSTETANGAKVVQSTLSRFFTGVKKRKVDTPDELISFVRIPNELFSGVKQIQPLSKRIVRDATKSHYFELDSMHECSSILDLILEPNLEISNMSRLEGILVDPPWEFYVADGRNDGLCSWNITDFQKLMEKVITHMSAGLVFVWTHKLIQADVVRMMYTIDCKYVENLVWFKKSVNNVHLDNPSPYISSTKEILLIFKKGDGFELRHQRSPDVIIDFEIPTEQWIDDEYTEPKPPGVYDMIETLLPKAGFDDRLKRGRFLELWAKRNSPRREGWIMFHENKKHRNIE